MFKKYTIPVALLLILAFVLALLPSEKAHDELPPDELLQQITSSSRFLSPDVVADRLIKKDPSLMLVDVRDSNLYNEFTLPGAVNIPLKSILMPDNQETLNQEGLEYVFFSTGDILADQAWALCKRKKMENIYVMKGGLNEWFTSFYLIQPPPETASSEEIDLYQFRNGVRQYFTGSENVTAQKPQETITVVPKKKKSAAEGGC